MNNLMQHYPWAFVGGLLIVIVALIAYATHPDGFKQSDKKDKS